jgi:hypothetical protein
MGPDGEAGPVNTPLADNYAAAETIKRLLNVARTGQLAASAGSSAEMARKRAAETAMTEQQSAYLAKEGRLPGSGQGATDSTNTKDYNRRVAEARKANPTGTPAEIAADVARFESLYAKPPIKQEARPNAGEAAMRKDASGAMGSSAADLNREIARSQTELLSLNDESSKALMRDHIAEQRRQLANLNAPAAKAPAAPAPPTLKGAPKDMARAQQIRADFASGKISREEARRQVLALDGPK